MAITRAQQVRQMLEDGGMLVSPSLDGKRPGYRSAAAQSSRTGGSSRTGSSSSSSSDTSSDSGNDGGNTNRERGITQQYKGPKGTTGSITNVRDDGPKEYINGQEFNVNPTTPEERERKNFAISMAADKKRVADRKKRQRDLTFIENYLGPEGFTRRTKTSNLKDLGMLDRKFGTIGGIPTGILGPVVESFDVPEETALFDTDSIREIYGPMSTLAGKTGVKQSQLDTLSDLREDMDIEQKILDGTLTKGEFLDYRDRNKTEDRDDRGDSFVPIASKATDDTEDEDDTNTGGLAFRFMSRGGSPMDAPTTGGIMDLETGRQMYFLGKLVKKATRAVKKIVKSPIGKAAILGGAMYFGGGAGGLKSFFGKGSFNPFLMSPDKGSSFDFSGLGKILNKAGLVNLSGGLTGKGMFSAGALALTPLLFGQQEDDEEGEFYRGPGLDIPYIRGNPYTFRSRIGDGTGLMTRAFQDGGSTEREPVAKKTMPLLDMDGKEMDLREDGGFVPIGRMEKADDVPARLSKNEFVFTADAVRNAGEGDVDKGAEVMYNMMKNLESGGEVSEESQGLSGARKMFQTSKRLEEVL